MESYILAETRLFTQVKNIYTDINNPPYLGAVYAPVYMGILSTMAPIVGSSFVAGRTVSLFAALFIGFFIYRILKRETNSTYYSYVGALLFFASHYVYTWSSRYRPDFLGIFFSTCGIYLFLKYRHNRKIFLSIPLFLLAFFTKQSFLAAPGAILIYLFFNDRKMFVKFGLAIMGGVGCSLVLLNFITDGQYFLHTIKFLQTNPIYFMHSVPFFYKMLIIYPIILIFALLYLLHGVRRIHSVYIWWFIATITVAAYTASKEGAWINYFIELFAVICILVGMSLHKLKEDFMPSQAKQQMSLLAAVMILFQTLIIFHAPHLPNEIQKQYFFYHYGDMPSREEISENTKLAKLVYRIEGKVLSLDGFFYPGKDMNIELGPEPFLYPYLRKAGLWDQSSFVKRIRNQDFSMIISHKKASLFNYSIEKYYQLIDRTSNFFIYTPTGTSIVR